MEFKMNSIDEVIKNKNTGLYYNNRIILPFKAEFLKVIIENDVLTDFSDMSKDIRIVEHENFTDLYFKEFKNIKYIVSKYESIKLVVVEKGNDIFNFDNHKKIALYLKEKHKVLIEETDSDILFIE
jgi:hypothetical protein